MKVVLTGPRGNLGQALIDKAPHIEWLPIDRDGWSRLPSVLGAGQAVIHAASDLLTPVAAQPQSVMSSNLLTTAQILEHWPKASSARLIFLSSCAVYGRSQITDEDTDPTPLSINGVSKLLNEKMIIEFCEARGIDYQILRVFNTFGGRDRFSLLAHLKRALNEQRPFTVNNNGLSQRDFIHVDDVAAVILKLLEKPITHRILNVGSGETTRVREIVSQVSLKHPELELRHAQRREAEYSRAEISRLRELFPEYRFRCVLDYVREEF